MLECLLSKIPLLFMFSFPFLTCRHESILACVTHMPASIHDDMLETKRETEIVNKYNITHMPASIHDDM